MASFSLPAHLEIGSLEVLMAELRGMMRSPGRDVAFDGSAVTRVDAVGVQLLVAVARTLRDEGRTLRWVAPSAAIVQGAQTLGLREAIGLD